MERFVLAIDQGTTGSRALIVNASGHIVADAYAEFPQLYPQPGWVEHDPEEIWQTTLRRRAARARRGPARARRGCAAIGITNQRETTVVWDRRTRRPVHNAIVWQCRRTAAICDAAQGRRARARLPRAHRPAPRRLLLGHQARVAARARPRRCGRAPRRGELAFGTIDTWLVSPAHRRPAPRDRPHQRLAHAAVRHPRARLGARAARAPGRPGGHAARGRALAPACSATTVARRCSAAEVPIAGIAGDQQAALFGQACFDAGPWPRTPTAPAASCC